MAAAGVQSIQAQATLEARTVFVSPVNSVDAKDFGSEQDDIRAVFEKVGPIAQIRPQLDAVEKRFGFAIEFLHVRAAQTAIYLDGIVLHGRTLCVSSTVHTKSQSQFAQPGESSSKPSAVAPSKTTLLPHNHLMPDDLQLMPQLIPFVGQLEGYCPLDDDSVPGDVLVQELATAQAGWITARANLEAANLELEMEMNAATERAVDLAAIAVAAGARMELHHTVRAVAQVRLQRTIVIVDCPADTTIVVRAIEAAVARGPVRLYHISPTLRLRPSPHCVHVGVEFADDTTAVALAKAGGRLPVGGVGELNTAGALQIGLLGPLPIPAPSSSLASLAAVARAALCPPSAGDKPTA